MKTCSFSWCDTRCWIIAGALIVWFVVFPEDLETLMTPIRSLFSLIGDALALTFRISPWLYGLLAVVAICWTARTILGNRSGQVISRTE